MLELQELEVPKAGPCQHLAWRNTLIHTKNFKQSSHPPVWDEPVCSSQPGSESPASRVGLLCNRDPRGRKSGLGLPQLQPANVLPSFQHPEDPWSLGPFILH